MAKLIPLFSGSKGNSYFVYSDNKGILIDAGKSTRQIEVGMNMAGLSMDMIKGAFITHEHSDHTASLKVLTKKYNIPVYATKGTMDELIRCHCLCETADAYYIGQKTQCSDFVVEAVLTPHDSKQSCAYKIYCPNGESVMIATDMGHMKDDVRECIYGSDLVVLESNHDVRMLKTGGYPQYLKNRILSDYGHLSNDMCAKELPGIVNSGTKKIILAHISQENNTFSKVQECALSSLNEAGYCENKDFSLSIATQETNGKVVMF